MQDYLLKKGKQDGRLEQQFTSKSSNIIRREKGSQVKRFLQIACLVSPPRCLSLLALLLIVLKDHDPSALFCKL